MKWPDLYREVMLRAELSRLRGLLDQYAAEHAGGLRPDGYPRSLDDLVREGYLPEIPVDPITGGRGLGDRRACVPYLRPPTGHHQCPQQVVGGIVRRHPL